MTPLPPLVSICITTYQYGRFVAAAVDSALAQTHPRVEVVVVDDGSTDETQQVLAGYGDRITVVRQDNAGQGAAVTAAVQRASGEVVLLLDADDLLEPTVAAAAVEALADPAVVDVQYLGELVDGDGEPLGQRIPRTAALLGAGDLLPVVLRHRCYPWQPTSGHAYRRSALLRVLPIPAQTYVVAADSYLAEVVPLVGRTAVLDQVGFRYRVHGDNDSLSAQVDGAYFRTRIGRIVDTHAHVLRVADELGVRGVHPDVRGPRDPALLSYRLASLRLEPRAHPFPEERRWSLALQGLHAVATHPLLSARSRFVRAVWFLLVWLLPGAPAEQVVRRLTPDVPRATRTHRPPPPAPGLPLEQCEPADPAGAWVELLEDVRDRDVLVVDGTGGPAAELLRAQGARVRSMDLAALAQTAPACADAVVLAGTVSAAACRAAARGLRPGGVLLLVSTNRTSPLGWLDGLGRRGGLPTGSLPALRRAAQDCGLPPRAQYGLLRSVQLPSTMFELDHRAAAARVLAGSNVLNEGLRRRAVDGLRWAVRRGWGGPLVPGVALLCSAGPLSFEPPLGRIGVLGSTEVKLLYGDPTHSVDKVYGNTARAAAEADALEAVAAAWPGLAPVLLERRSAQRNRMAWLPGRTLDLDRMSAAEGEQWVVRAAALLGELHRRLGPAPDDGRLLHGDFWLGNLLVDAQATTIVGVIDWTETTYGTPLTDLDWLVRTWSHRADLDVDAADRLRTLAEQAYSAQIAGLSATG